MARRLANILGVIVVLTGATSARAIIFGEACTRDEHPAAVALLANVAFDDPGPLVFLDAHCAAVVIADDAVLTAAHCVDPAILVPPSATNVVAQFAIARLEDLTGVASGLPAERVDVVDVVIDPLWDPAAFNAIEGGVDNDLHDLAVLSLAASAGVSPAFIAEGANAGATVAIVGWGDDENDAHGTRRCAVSFVNETGPVELEVGLGAASPRGCDRDSGGPVFVSVDVVDGTVDVAVAVESHSFDVATRCDQGSVAQDVDIAFVDGALRDACSRAVRTSCANPGALLLPEVTDAGVVVDAGDVDAGAGDDAGVSADGGGVDGGGVDGGGVDVQPSGCACAPAGVLPLALTLRLRRTRASLRGK